MSSECKDCEDDFCCIYLGQRTCPVHCGRQNCFCARCQLHRIEIICPAVKCQHCHLLKECNNYKYIGGVANGNTYVLQRYCVEHCPTLNCHSWVPTTVDIPEAITIPDYSQVIQNVDPKETFNIHQHGISIGRELSWVISKPSRERDTRIGLRVSKKTRGGSKTILADKGARRIRRG